MFAGQARRGPPLLIRCTLVVRALRRPPRCDRSLRMRSVRTNAAGNCRGHAVARSANGIRQHLFQHKLAAEITSLCPTATNSNRTAVKESFR